MEKNNFSFSSKILKMDKNNQYGQAMTRPLPYSCVKKQKNTPTMGPLNRILDSIDHSDTLGHMFTVDIKFHDINEKTLLFNEIYPHIFEKKNRSL